MRTAEAAVSDTLICTNRGWENSKYPVIRDKEDLTLRRLKLVKPRYVFFPFWSHKIPPELHENYECVIFHTSDLPYGRGGSPIQNLIKQGIYETQVTALRCVEEFDAGPIYLKHPVSLHGTAEEIYIRLEATIKDMIQYIRIYKPSPQPQKGEAFYFMRRGEQNLEKALTVRQAYDYIRMLDAEGYPPAYIEAGPFRFEFCRASLKRGHIKADVTIKGVADEGTCGGGSSR